MLSPQFFDAEPGESVYCRAAHNFQAGLEPGIFPKPFSGLAIYALD